MALARAFLKNAPLILMDEPTAALDPELEETLTRTTQALVKQRTFITIAHRTSTIWHADEIIVLEQGQVIEKGPPAEVLSHQAVNSNFYQPGEAGL